MNIQLNRMNSVEGSEEDLMNCFMYMLEDQRILKRDALCFQKVIDLEGNLNFGGSESAKQEGYKGHERGNNNFEQGLDIGQKDRFGESKSLQRDFAGFFRNNIANIKDEIARLENLDSDEFFVYSLLKHQNYLYG